MTEETTATKASDPCAGDELLGKLRSAVYKSLATDDRTGGEGDWQFRIDPDGVSRVALPPEGTRRETLVGTAGRVTAELGGGHVADVWVDPKDHRKGRRAAFVIEGAYVPPATGAPTPAALSEGTGEGERYPVPAGPAGPGSPPPPAQGEPGGG